LFQEIPGTNVFNKDVCEDYKHVVPGLLTPLNSRATSDVYVGGIKTRNGSERRFQYELKPLSAVDRYVGVEEQ
jgi:hypothetical protein